MLVVFLVMGLVRANQSRISAVVGVALVLPLLVGDPCSFQRSRLAERGEGPLPLEELPVRGDGAQRAAPDVAAGRDGRRRPDQFHKW